jgi:hypothetical protein
MKTHNTEMVRNIAEISRSPVKLILCIVLSMVFAAVPVMALTPDGQKQAEKTVCDNEAGAAFGLCNAYCKAMDCDSENTNASKKACQKKKEKFFQLTGRYPPCEGDECFDANKFAGAGQIAFRDACKDQAECPNPNSCVTVKSCDDACAMGGFECDLCNKLLIVFGQCKNACK